MKSPTSTECNVSESKMRCDPAREKATVSIVTATAGVVKMVKESGEKGGKSEVSTNGEVRNEPEQDRGDGSFRSSCHAWFPLSTSENCCKWVLL